MLELVFIALTSLPLFGGIQCPCGTALPGDPWVLWLTIDMPGLSTASEIARYLLFVPSHAKRHVGTDMHLFIVPLADDTYGHDASAAHDPCHLCSIPSHDSHTPSSWHHHRAAGSRSCSCCCNGCGSCYLQPHGRPDHDATGHALASTRCVMLAVWLL